MKNFEKFIIDCKSINIDLTVKQLNQFDQYYDLLIKWNDVMNLTTITDFEDVCKLHFLDSLVATVYFDFQQKDNLSLIDIGTGAGFPGIPLKIIYPNLNITLFDSLQKRLNFLNEVIDVLQLNNEVGSIETVHGRAEDFAEKKKGTLREKYDICCARAVANMSTLSEYCLPYVKTGGTFIAYKSNKLNDEMVNARKAVHLLGGKVDKIQELMLPNSDIERNIVIIKKIEPTSKIYPRKAGLPSKSPL